MKRRTFLAGLLAAAAVAPLASAAVGAARLVFGRVANVPADQIDGVRDFFRVHDGPAALVEAVYDGGLPLKIGPDFPTLIDLLRADIPAGTVGTCNAEGRMKLGTPAIYNVTVDLVGANRPKTVEELDGLFLVARAA